MDLTQMRNKIDQLDAELLRLLNKRIELAVRTKRLKSGIVDQAREDEIIQRAKEKSRWLISPAFTEELFLKILNESRALQAQELTFLGFRGEHGALSENAGKLFSPKAALIPHGSYEELFASVQNGSLDQCIVPVENSIEGGVSEISDLLLDTDLSVVGEVKLYSSHCLLTLPETDHRELKIVYSHPLTLTHCRGFIHRNHLEAFPFEDAASAALMLVTKRPEAASVIASRECGELYQLRIIKEAIEDEKNLNRFLVLAKNPLDERSGNKCSLLFSTQDKAGSLFKILELFSKENINLTRIESRPGKLEKVGTPVFFLDFNGSSTDPKIAKILEQIQASSTFYRFLGCYQAGASN